jgi:hypothetical protein
MFFFGGVPLFSVVDKVTTGKSFGGGVTFCHPPCFLYGVLADFTDQVDLFLL